MNRCRESISQRSTSASVESVRQKQLALLLLPRVPLMLLVTGLILMLVLLMLRVLRLILLAALLLLFLVRALLLVALRSLILLVIHKQLPSDKSDPDPLPSVTA